MDDIRKEIEQTEDLWNRMKNIRDAEVNVLKAKVRTYEEELSILRTRAKDFDDMETSRDALRKGWETLMNARKNLVMVTKAEFDEQLKTTILQISPDPKYVEVVSATESTFSRQLPRAQSTAHDESNTSVFDTSGSHSYKACSKYPIDKFDLKMKLCADDLGKKFVTCGNMRYTVRRDYDGKFFDARCDRKKKDSANNCDCMVFFQKIEQEYVGMFWGKHSC